jgi:LmbE family N-acetylglucosaminyl deacetylase
MTEGIHSLRRVQTATTVQKLSADRPVLVLSPHPDDESLGCGALLAAAFAQKGAHVVCMTDGGASHPASLCWPPARLAALRSAELEQAVRALGGGARDITSFGLPDSGLAALGADFDRLAATVCALAAKIAATSLFAPAPTDGHSDHSATAAIAGLAARRAGMRLFYYPVWSRWDDQVFRRRLSYRTEFRLAANGWAAAKERAIRSHRSQLGEVVLDDPDGFAMEERFIRLFVDEPELFFEAVA